MMQSCHVIPWHRCWEGKGNLFLFRFVLFETGKERIMYLGLGLEFKGGGELSWGPKLSLESSGYCSC